MLAAAPRPFPRLQADGLALPLPDASVDGATCGFALRNFTDLRATFFAELARVIRPGGRIALLEVAEPPNPMLRVGPRHLLPADRAASSAVCLSDGDAYAYLPTLGRLPPAGRRDARRCSTSSASPTSAGTC